MLAGGGVRRGSHRKRRIFSAFCLFMRGKRELRGLLNAVTSVSVVLSRDREEHTFLRRHEKIRRTVLAL